MNRVYLLPGQGGLLTKGLGEVLTGRGIEVVGRETIGAFRELSFQEKIERIAKDLRDHFWHEDARIVANSFGGYLFLHAQTLLKPFIGRVLLFSPIVGEFEDQNTWMSFRPPRVHLNACSLKAKLVAIDFRTPRLERFVKYAIRDALVGADTSEVEEVIIIDDDAA